MKRKNDAEQVHVPQKAKKGTVEITEDPKKRGLRKWLWKLKDMVGSKEDPEKMGLNKWFWILIIIVLSIIILLQAARDSLDKYWLILVGVFLIVTISLIAIIWFVPRRYVRSLQNKDLANTHSEFEREKEQLKLEDATRKTFAQIIGGGIFLLGLLFTYNTFILNRDGQITDRFSTAMELLGHKDAEVRLGGLYALERIAKDSPKDHWVIMEILCAYVREKSPNKKLQVLSSTVDNTNHNSSPVTEQTNEPIKTDVKAALTIILRRVVSQDPGNARLDLSGANLKGLNLKGAHIEIGNLNKAKLTRTDLSGNADLSGLDLSGADMTDADVRYANLIGTILIDTDLTGTDIEGANLLAAKLVRATLVRANLTRANLSGSDFSKANLSDAILWDVTLFNTIFTSTNLTGIRDLTFEKIRDTETEIDSNTILPAHLIEKKDELLGILTERREKERKEREKRSILNRRFSLAP